MINDKNLRKNNISKLLKLENLKNYPNTSINDFKFINFSRKSNG